MSSDESSDSESGENNESGEESTGESSNNEFRKTFNNALNDYDRLHQASQKKAWTQARVDEVINGIKVGRETLKSGLRRTAMEYYWMNKYDVKTVGKEEHLVLKKSNSDGDPPRLIPRESYFDILKGIHATCKHGGRDKMMQHIKNKYYIPKKAVEIFAAFCPACNNKKNVQSKDIARQHISVKLNIRGLLDLIDFQICPDGEFNWLLIYQDEATKFLNLRPLKTNSDTEVLCELMKIFLTFGAPTLLQLDDRHKFVPKLTEGINEMWSDCRVIHKSSRKKGGHNEFEQALHAWMKENNSTKWSFGCFVVQYERNTSVHRIIGRTPFKTLLSCDPKADLCPTKLPASILKSHPEVEVKIEATDDNDDKVPGLSSDEDE